MTMDLGVVIALIGLILVIAGHLCTTVWWMSKITTILGRMALDVENAMKDIKGLMPRSDCVSIHGHLEKQFDDIWKELKNKVDK